MRLTHISYAKRYNERCLYTEPAGIPHQTRVSKRQKWVRMARIRLVTGGGNRRMRMAANSTKDIREKWPVCSGPVRIKILGERKDLLADLETVVKATGLGGWIEGGALVDLCIQRSEMKGSGCDAPKASEEPLMAIETPLPSPAMPAAQVRQYAYRLCAKKNKDDIRREIIGVNKQSNHGSSVLSQQAPLVAKAHLLDVVRKVGKSERFKGKLLSDFKFKSPRLRRGKVITSPLLPSQKTEEGNQRSFVMREGNSLEIGLSNHEYQHTNDICTLKCPKANKRGQEAQSRHPGSTNYDDIECDVIIAGNGDVTRPDLNKPIARKRYVPRKQLFMPSEESFKSSLRICSRTFTFIALLLATVISVLGGLFNQRL